MKSVEMKMTKQIRWQSIGGLLIVMAIGFPLLTGLLGLLGGWLGETAVTNRLIEIPVVLMGLAWIQIGLHLRQ